MEVSQGGGLGPNVANLTVLIVLVVSPNDDTVVRHIRRYIASETELLLIEATQASEERLSLILMALVDLATSGAAWESTKERRDMLADGG